MSDTDIGATEDDAVVSRRRPEGKADAQPECRPTPTQPIGAFSVCWHHVVVSGIQDLWQTVHTPRLLL